MTDNSNDNAAMAACFDFELARVFSKMWRSAGTVYCLPPNSDCLHLIVTSAF